jgi:hypothetical protein
MIRRESTFPGVSRGDRDFGMSETVCAKFDLESSRRDAKYLCLIDYHTIHLMQTTRAASCAWNDCIGKQIYSITEESILVLV